MVAMGERSFHTVTEIDASAESVWRLLGDVVGWPKWTPTVTQVRPLGEPDLVPGAAFEVRQPGVPTAVFTVESCAVGRSFVWTSRSAGVRNAADHVIDELDPHRCRVTLSFSMAGPAAAAVWSLAGRKIRRFVELEARSLKAAAEAAESGQHG